MFALVAPFCAGSLRKPYHKSTFLISISTNSAGRYVGRILARSPSKHQWCNINVRICTVTATVIASGGRQFVPYSKMNLIIGNARARENNFKSNDLLS